LTPALRDPDLAKPDRFLATLDHLTSHRYEPGANKVDQHPICEAMSKHQRLTGALLLYKQL
jgi:hypothetical protein